MRRVGLGRVQNVRLTIHTFGNSPEKTTVTATVLQSREVIEERGEAFYDKGKLICEGNNNYNNNFIKVS